MGARLLDPQGLLLWAALAPLVLLYVLRTRRKRQRVSSTWLWAEARRDLVARHPWRRLIPEPPLVIEFLALLLLGLTLARPSTGGGSVDGDHVAIVVDASASMQTHVGGPAGATTRMDLARRAAHDVVARLSTGAEATVIVATRDAEVACPPERDRSRIDTVIDRLEARDVEGRLAPAVALAAERLRAAGGRSRLVLITDEALADATPLAVAGVPTDVVRVGDGEANAAIVRLDVRPATDPVTHHPQVQVFAMVQSFGAPSGPAREAQVTVALEGSDLALASRRLLLAPTDRQAVVLSFEPSEADRERGLVVRLTPSDALPADDVAFGRVPADPRMPVVVASDGAASWTARALAADADVDSRRLTLEELGRVNVDPHALVVVEGACPASVPGGDTLVVDPPAGPCFGLTAGDVVAQPEVTSWDADDPRLRFLSLDGLLVARARALTGAGAGLVRSASATLVGDASSPGRTVTVVGFDFGETDWPLKASFVLFVRNVVELARAHRLEGAAGPVSTGDAPRVRVPPGTERAFVGGSGLAELEVPVRDGLAELPRLDRVGFTRVRWSEPHVGEALLATNLTSARESDVRPGATRLDGAASGTTAVTAASTPEASAWVRWLAGLAALALAADLAWATGAAARRQPPGARSSRARRALAVGVLPLAILSYELALVWHLVPETYVRFRHPLALAFFAALALGVGTRLGRLPPRLEPWRRRALAATSALATLAAGLVVAEPEIGAPLDRLAVVAVVDRSRSMDRVPDLDGRLRSELEAAERSMRPADRLGRVVFGASAAVESPLRLRSEPAPPQRVKVGRDATDLEAAMRRALVELPADAAGRLVLLTDGVATRGDTTAGAEAAIAAGVPVDVFPLDHPPVPDLRVVEVRAPTRVDVGEPFELRVVTSSTAPVDLELRLRQGSAEPRVLRGRVRAGEDVLHLREIATEPGLRRYDVAVTALDAAADLDPDDNAASAFVHVRGEARALVLEGDPGHGAPMVKALEGSGLRAIEQSTAGAPADVGELAAYDLVVLSDIPARDLTSTQVDALSAYVKDLGGGLLLMGGDRSLGPGGYARTSLEDVSPVAFDLKQDRRRASLAEVIAIDYSGSMGAAVGGHTKLELANEAAARSASLLGPGDRIGVEHVDTEVRWTVPMSSVDDPHALGAAIRGVGVGGGGIYTDVALLAAYDALSRERVNLRHVLLFADGADAEQIGGCRAIVKGAAGRGVTTSVISLGRGSDSPELEVLSKVGGGRFYLIEDATRLPEVFAQETILATRSAIHEDPFRAAPGEPGPATRGVDLSAQPALGGYVVTLPKPRASVLLSGPDSDPVLASWNVGLGRAGAFASDYKDRWGQAWLGWPGAAQLFGQLGRDLARRADDARVRLQASATSGGELRVNAEIVGDDGRSQSLRRLTVRVAGPDGFEREVPLEAVAAGRYAATVPLSRPGTYMATARDDASGEAVGTTGAVLTSGDELRPVPSDRALLSRLARATGGRERASLAGLFDDRGARRFAYRALSDALVLIAALSMLASVAARRLGLPEALLAKLARRRDGRARAKADARAARALAEVTVVEGARRLRDALRPGRSPGDGAVEPRARRDAPVRLAGAEHRDPPQAAPVTEAVTPDRAPGERPLTTVEKLAAKRRRRG